jgi:hypothetical protein
VPRGACLLFAARRPCQKHTLCPRWMQLRG